MREISPAENLSADDFYSLLPPGIQAIVDTIRQEKKAGTRLRPSASLIDCSLLLTRERRKAVLDKVADLVDENLAGRSEMCLQFTALLSRALLHLGLQARPVVSKALYFDELGGEIFRWDHSWVRIGEEVVDGNVDCLFENPMVPETVDVRPYWGPIRKTPKDRKLREVIGVPLNSDSDVDEIWWPEMKHWLDEGFRQA